MADFLPWEISPDHAVKRMPAQCLIAKGARRVETLIALKSLGNNFQSCVARAQNTVASAHINSKWLELRSVDDRGPGAVADCPMMK